MPANSYKYCDKNPNTKDPRGRDEGIAKRKARKDKRSGPSNTNHYKNSETNKLKATVAAQKKLLAINEAQNKTMEMEAATKITFNEDKGLGIQAAALHSYLTSLEAHSVSLGDEASAHFNCYTLATGLIDSKVSATNVTTTDKISNSRPHKAQLRTANGRTGHTSHEKQR